MKKKISEQTISGYSDEIIKKTLLESNETLEKTEKTFKILLNKYSNLSLSTVTPETTEDLKYMKKLNTILNDKTYKYYKIVEPYSFFDYTEDLKRINSNSDNIENYTLLISDIIELVDGIITIYNGDLKQYLK